LKTEMTSFDVAAVVHELNQAVKNARIEDVYQINQSTLLLRLRKPNEPTKQLLIEAGKRLHTTNYALKKPAKPPAFCMILRKYLRGGTINDIEQHEFERTVTLKINTKQGMMQLIVELFGDGNIILTNQQNTIVSALVFKKMRDRNILRNTAFEHAPESGKNPFKVARAQLDELRNLGQLEIVRALTRFFSIGGLYAEEVLLRANIDKRTQCYTLTAQQLHAIFTQLHTVLSSLQEGKLEPLMVIDKNGEAIDATPIKLKRYESLETKPYSQLNEALDEYYTQTSLTMRVSEAQRRYEKELSRHQRMLQEQQEALEDARKTVEQNKRIGDLIYIRLSELQVLQQRISDAKKTGESWDQIAERLKEEKLKGLSPAVYFDSFNPKNMVLNVSIDGTVFPIRIDHSVQANAAEYYERMKKAGRKIEGAEKALKETQRRIEELRKEWTERTEETRAEAPAKVVKKAWYEKFRWFTSSDGFLVLGGRDSTTNEILLKKHLEPHDIVFHADIVGAPFVVVKTEGKSATEQVIKEAAEFAASYSRAWREKLGTLDVYWIRPDQVSKTAPSGQYLAKGAFVIKGTKNYVRRVPLRVALGTQKTDEQLRVTGGPVEAIRKHTNAYVDIVPGDEPSAKLAKRIRSLLFQKVAQEDRERISKISIEEIQQFIPLGKGSISTAKR